MKISIRQAEAKDASKVAPLIVQAMEDLAFDYVNGTEEADALPLFEFLFTETENQYSHDNTLVFEEEGEILGSITGYDGDKLKEYRDKLLAIIQKDYKVSNLYLEDETQGGEFYLDTLSVSPKAQGKGVGSRLLRSMIQKAKEEGYPQVGLLVDIENPNAKRLYERIGFKVSGKVALADGQYEQMVYLL